MIDISKERVINFKEAATLCPRRRQGKKPHISTFYRWSRQGLEVIRVGSQLVTSVEALQRFFDRKSQACRSAHRAEQLLRSSRPVSAGKH